jgi:hypothetical protein
MGKKTTGMSQWRLYMSQVRWAKNAKQGTQEQAIMM